MSQQHFVGLDVSVKATALCIVDAQGGVIHRATIESHPAAISEHLVALGFAAVCSIVLGMGLPTAASYLMVVFVAGPAIMELGVSELGAHLFVFYYAVLSAITPPVALAVFAGALIGWLFRPLPVLPRLALAASAAATLAPATSINLAGAGLVLVIGGLAFCGAGRADAAASNPETARS